MSKPPRISPADKDRSEYQVGYRRPPQRTQFRKGQSGNPKGRPKGRKNNRTIWDNALQRKRRLTIDGKSVRMESREIIAEKVVDAAVRGDWRAVREVKPFLIPRDSKESFLEEVTPAVKGTNCIEVIFVDAVDGRPAPHHRHLVDQSTPPEDITPPPRRRR